MNAYAAVYIKTKAYIRTAKALKKLFESDSMFRESRFEIYLNSTREKNVSIFPNDQNGATTEAIAKAVSGIIDANVIALYGDDQSIGVAIYRNETTQVHYLYANGRVISEYNKYSLIPTILPSIDIDPYAVESSHFMWDNCFSLNPPVELKDHLELIFIRSYPPSRPPTNSCDFKVNPDLSWPQATVYDKAPIIPLSDPDIEALFRGLLAAAEETHTAALLDKYAGEIQIVVELAKPLNIQWLKPHMDGYLDPRVPRRLEGSQAYFVPDPEGKSVDWNDELPRFENFVIPDYNTYAFYRKKYFYTAYDRLGLGLDGVDGERNGYYSKGNKLYIFSPDMTACKIETLTGLLDGWFLNARGEMCVHTVTACRDRFNYGSVHSTRIYRIPLPQWDNAAVSG